MKSKIEYSINSDNLSIKNSYKIKSGKEMTDILFEISSKSDFNTIVWKLPMSRMVNEWKAHNLLYNLGLFKSHTKDVDINDEPWYRRFCYLILSKFYNLIY